MNTTDITPSFSYQTLAFYPSFLNSSDIIKIVANIQPLLSIQSKLQDDKISYGAVLKCVLSCPMNVSCKGIIVVAEFIYSGQSQQVSSNYDEKTNELYSNWYGWYYNNIQNVI